MRVLIGFDGSDEAAIVLGDDLERAGLPVAAELLIVSVLDAWLPPEPSAGDEVPQVVKRHRAAVLAEVDRLRVRAEREADRLRAAHPRWRIAVEASADAPAWAIIRRAEMPFGRPSGGSSDARPDLVVVGSHGKGGLKRLLLGSVSHKVVSELRQNVRIARHSQRPKGAPPRIVVGVDGSEHALAAIDVIAARPWPTGTAVRVAAFEPVVDASAAYGPLWGGDPLGAEAMAAAMSAEDLGGARIAGEAADRLRSKHRDLAVEMVVRRGDPKHGLVQEAADWDEGADLLVVGAKGARGIERFVLGSVSTWVAMHAACSVEVVHHPA